MTAYQAMAASGRPGSAAGEDEPPSLWADVVIVGSGMAGSSLAAELASRSVGRVVVVEAGPDAGVDHYRWANEKAAADAMWLRPTRDVHFRRSYQSRDASFLALAGARRRLGGRSLYWHGVAVPVEHWALAGWPLDVVGDLTHSWRGGPGLYSRVEQELTAWAGHHRDTSDACLELGAHHFRRAPQAVVRSADGRRWRAYSPAEQLKEHSEVYCNCEALGLLICEGSVRGLLVNVGGCTRKILAGKIVLAAGTIENSRLAIQALSVTGAMPSCQLTGLVDKISQGLIVAFHPKSVPAEILALARPGSLLLSHGDAACRSNIFLYIYINKHERVIFDCYCMGEQLGGPTGRVTCEPAETWPWPVSVECALAEDDRSVVAAQQDLLRGIYAELCTIMNTRTAGIVFADRFGSTDLSERLLAGDRCRAINEPVTYSFPLGSEQHEAGTLPFDGGIVDTLGQFSEISGLYALGPCTFPRTGAANPTMTILALSKRLAAAI